MERRHTVAGVELLLLFLAVGLWWGVSSSKTPLLHSDNADLPQGLAPEEVGAWAKKTFNLNRELQLATIKKAYDVPIEFYGRVVDQDGWAVEGVLAALSHRPIEIHGKIVDQYGAPVWGSLGAAKIVFYGKVVDQDGKPLSEVQVSGKTGSKVAFYTEEHREYQTTTDVNGLFVFDNFKGDGLVIDLKKAGYKFGSDNRNFLYSAITGDQKRHHPNPEKPVMFTMFKSMGTEPLIFYYGEFFYGKTDGTPLRIDLANIKSVNQGGDLEIKIVKNQNTKEWLTTLTVLEGGLVEEGKDYQFLAPLTGYENPVLLDIPLTQRNFENPYYIKSQNGRHFSRVVLSINLDSEDKFGVALRVWLNPSGSRNLEYDPKKRINK
jgi:hypothetical protein